MARTEYLVLQQAGENGGLIPVGETSASSARGAIHRLVTEQPALLSFDAESDAYTFVAIPVRSWQPMRVRTQTTMKIKIETVLP